MKKLAVLAIAAVFALCLTACGSSESSAASSSSGSSDSSSTASQSSEMPHQEVRGSIGYESSASATKTKDFDGSKYEETGDCSLWLVIKSGDNRDGSVLQIATTKNNTFMQIDAAFEGGDGSVATIYIDGMESRKVNVSNDEDREIIDLQDRALNSGVHDVELVQMDGDTPTIYKKTQYEIVK